MMQIGNCLFAGGRMYKSKGFTLIELVITIVIMGIIAAIAAPSFGTLLSNKKLDDNANELMLILKQARSQAVLLRSNTVLQLNGSTASSPTNFFWISNDPDIQLQGIPQGYNAPPDIVFNAQGMLLPRSFVKMKEVTNTLSGEKEWVADQMVVDGVLKDQMENYPRTITLCSEKLKKSKIITYSVVGSFESVQEGSC
ncbi:pilus assembly FimT family protein [Acinetobacter cumulans]|nr:prepilin-type N-terminal cleavage/methylation domain-containing protein [Acinetobacter cumulans]